jgi:uncharacterized protein (UPF0297 family)
MSLSASSLKSSTSSNSSCCSTDLNECAICLETLNQAKCCTTDCGHTFHSRCIFKNFKNSFDCPLCRHELVEEDEEDEEDEDDEDSDGEYEDDDDSSYDTISINTTIEESDETNPEKLRIKQIYEAIKKKGYNELDFISFLLIDNFPGEIKQKKDVFLRCIKMMQEIDKICDREIAVDYRDNRTYATVVQGTVVKE